MKNQHIKEQILINQQLKIFYTSIEEENIPDRFIKMLEQLEMAELEQHKLVDKDAKKTASKSGNDGN